MDLMCNVHSCSELLPHFCENFDCPFNATVSLLIKLDIKSVKSGIFDSFDSSRKRTNWLCQYKMIKQIFTKFEHKYDFSKIPYKQNKYQYLLISTTPRFLIKIYKT